MPQAPTPTPHSSAGATSSSLALALVAWSLRSVGYLGFALQHATVVVLPKVFRHAIALGRQMSSRPPWTVAEPPGNSRAATPVSSHATGRAAGAAPTTKAAVVLRRATLPVASVGALLALALLLTGPGGQAPAAPTLPPHVPEANAAAGETGSPTLPADPAGRLEHMRQALRTAADSGARLRAAARIAGLRDIAVTTLEQQLGRVTPVPAADYKNVLRAVGAVVPNARGVFPADAGEPVDWLAGLAQLSPGRLASGLGSAHQEALYSVALMRSSAASGDPVAAQALLLFAYRHGGAFRDECGRLIRSMGEAAIPALVRARSLKHPQAHRIRRYAHYQLDRLNRATPELALGSSDQRLQAEILHAYGETRHPSAVDAVVSRTNAPAASVRQAARWAAVRYLTGPEPAVQRRKLRLSGGRTSERELTVYLNYRQLARRALKRTILAAQADPTHAGGKYSAEQLASAPSLELARRLFEIYDGRRRAVSEGLLARAQALATGRKLGEATRLADRLLADDPEHPRRRDLAAIYHSRALELLATRKYAQALRQVSRAVHLTPPDAQQSAHLRALKLVCEALRDGLDAPSSEWRLERALGLAPGMRLANDELTRLRQGRSVRTAALGGVALAALGALVFAAGRRRRRRHDHVR